MNGIFYPNPSGGGPFDFSQLSNPAFSQRFQFLYFNPFPQHFQLACLNDPGVTTDTRPFTDVIQNPDGTCSTVKAQGNGQQAGLGSLFNFEATFTTEMTVASAGQLTFALYVDDGWIFGAGPRIGGTEQPTYVSGLLQNPPPSSPLKGYPVVGAWNTTSHGGNVSLTVNFPAAGTYPIEFDYTECCGGGNSLLLMTSNFGPIGPNLNPVQQTFGTCNGVGSQALSPSACMNEPVNTLTGAYTTLVTDARLAGIGVPLAFTRSYTSADTTQGRFGIGWTDGYASSLVVQANGDVLVHGEDGQQLYFLKEDDGSYAGPPGSLSTLTAVGGGYQLRRADQTTYAFNSQGQLTSQRDRNGKGLSFTYDGSGQLTTINDSVGRAISLSYNGSGFVSQLSLPDGRNVNYGYTGNRLTSVTDLRNGTTSYGYDAGNRLATIVDQNNHTIVQNTYGPDGRVTLQQDGAGKRTNFSWDPATQTATVTDARNNAWKDIYQNNVLMKRIDPLGDTTTYSYDSFDNLTSITDARGNRTTMTYDDRHNMLTRTAPAPLSYQEIWTYDPMNNVLTDKDGRGNTTSYGYDSAGNRTSMTGPDPDGSGPLVPPVTLYGRDPSGTGLLSSITDPNGKTTRFSYDNAGDLVSVLSPLGEKATMGYDSAGRMTSWVDPRGNVSGGNPALYTWTLAFNPFDQITTVTDPLQHQTSFAYDPAGNLQSRTDADQHTTNYGYDADERLQTITAPGSTVTSYGYDAVGNLQSRTDANQHAINYSYDAANRLSSMVMPSGSTWTYGYDANGNRTSMVDANGNATPATGDGTTTYGYDALNRLTSVSFSDSTPAVTFGYDGDSNRTQITDGSGTVNYVYDTLNQLASVTRGTNSFSYTYDEAGQLLQRSYPDGTAAAYTYDDDGRRLSASSGGQTTSYIYDAAGDLTKSTLPASNGYVENRTYDTAERLTKLENMRGTSTLSSFTYTRDPVGNPTLITGTGTATTTSFKYDNRDRLTEACYQTSCTHNSDPFIRYSYDAVGNRRSETRPVNSVTNYNYNSDDELTSTTGSSNATYSYDADGNEVSAGSRTFSYDLESRLIATTNSSVTTTYSYDGDGNRLRSVTGTTTTNYQWDIHFPPLPQLALEQDGTGGLIRRYLYGIDRISMTTPAGAFYYHRDGIGSTANLTSATGATQISTVYEPFGAIRSQTIPNKVTPPANPILFAGEYNDTNSGLYNFRARQYDPTLGRFVSRDPISPPAGNMSVGAYVYVDDQPTVLLDPTGLCSPWHCFTEGISYAGKGLSAVGDFIEDHPITVGGCVGGSVTIKHANFHGNACVVVSTNGNFGGTATGGGGYSTQKYGYSIGWQGLVANARCANDLGGPFVNGTGSIGEGPQVTGSVFGGKGVSKQPVVGVQIGRAFGGGTPRPWEATFGGTYTYATNFFGPGCNGK